jgi:hypothetical protein
MSADLVWGWATFGFVLMVPGTLWVGHYDRRLLVGVDGAEMGPINAPATFLRGQIFAGS